MTKESGRFGPAPAQGQRVAPRSSVLVYAIGNESRGDDALGPLLMRALEEECGAGSGIAFIEAFQLQVEDALDLDGRALVLFVDAAVDHVEPLRFIELRTPRQAAVSSHALSPEELLGVRQRLGLGFGQASTDDGAGPACFQLTMRGISFVLGEGLSEAAAENLGHALELCRRLMRDPTEQAWRRECDRHAPKKADASTP